MILNKPGQSITVEAPCMYLYIGQEIVANNNSIYAGLPGVITMIHDGADKETENPTVDVYCDFTLPENDDYCAVLVGRFEVPTYEIPLEQVVMKPEMIEPKAAYQINPFTKPFYVLTLYVDTEDVCDTFVLGVSNDVDLLKRTMNRHIQTNARFINAGGYDSSLIGLDVSSFDTKSVPDDGKRFLWTAENKETYIRYTIFEAPFVLPDYVQKESDAKC